MRQTKYMDALTMIGFGLGALLIIMEVITGKWYYIVLALVIIFGSRGIGYLMDQGEANKKYKNKKRR